MSPLRRAIREALIGAEEKGDRLSRTFVFPAESLVFAGHFPGRPVLPGVVHVLMAQAALEDAGLPSSLERIVQAKFLMPVGPGSEIVMSIEPQGGGRWKVVFEADGECAARLDLALAASPAEGG